MKKLPPTEDSLHQHLLRVMYQLYIWITANYVDWQELPRAQDFGYKMVEDKYLSKLHRWSVTNEQHQNYLMTSCVFVKHVTMNVFVNSINSHVQLLVVEIVFVLWKLLLWEFYFCWCIAGFIKSCFVQI